MTKITDFGGSHVGSPLKGGRGVGLRPTYPKKMAHSTYQNIFLNAEMNSPIHTEQNFYFFKFDLRQKLQTVAFLSDFQL